MVAKKSEYQNQFRSSVVRKHQAIYLENLNLRHQRRDREFVHTPICWGELSDETDHTTSDSNEDDKPRTAPEEKHTEAEPQYQSIAEILADSRQKADAFKHKRSSEKTVVQTEIPSFEKLSLDCKEGDLQEKKLSRTAEENLKGHKKDIGDKSLSIYDIVDDENRKLNEKLTKTYALSKGKIIADITDESDTEGDEKVQAEIENDSNLRKRTFVKKRSRGSRVVHKGKAADCPRTSFESRSKAQPSRSSDYSSKHESPVPPLPLPARIRRPDRQARIPSAKSRPKSAASSVGERPPFITYGAGDMEDNLALHRTHNVRAPANVYGAALKAKIRREEERRKYRERKELAKNKAALMDKLSSVSPREQLDLRSEYQKQFQAYEPKEYERAVSARAVIPRSSPIRAVHRGGCLVVHVD
ncbi:uncharacterized protein LOC101851823 [Aplysia californica]|uniref:Uncharacterized protein LOC101851823 n=1 Tax=Aplysia californica TaxID=6500 RepID=A0ABM0K158_APLCA|nr:uncharacterized protein LOC101851823 [Aplysia californica]